MTRLPLRLGVVYDFRNPPDSGIATPRPYAEIPDQVAWLDGLGLVWFTEHHFVEDGGRASQGGGMPSMSTGA